MIKAGALTAAVAASLVGSAEAAVLLDFGSGAILNPSNSPGHVSGAIQGGSTWNRVGLSNPTGLLNNDGTSAAGISVTYGIAGTDLTNVSFTQAPTNAITGGGSAGIYQNSSPIRSGVFNSASRSILGIRVDGLPEGDYEIFTTARNTFSGSANLPSRVYYAAGPLSSTFETSTASNLDHGNVQSVTAAGANPTFVLGDQYQRFTVSVTASDPSVFLAFRGLSGELRPFVNSIEIAAVPEPGMTIAAAALAGGLLLRRRA